MITNELRANYSSSSGQSQGGMDNFGGAVALTDAQVFPTGVDSTTGSFNLSVLGLASYSLGGQTGPGLDAPEISRLALAGECALCERVVDMFCGMLGTVAGNLAITLGAQGGIYIGGGIVPRLGELFARSSFRSRFEQKGRFVHYLAAVPTYVITAKYPAFLGVSAILSEKLGH